ncbi:hypothetical protein DH2020_043766 [Rehmannia glutinosa]|uniref:Thioredoxin domain-containing protein n=1 Tax=Rehmannia glutinosa TaxID=99300 RepID=A0ABR0UIQ8_REHGL
MPIAFAPTSNPLPPVRAVIAPANIIYSSFQSYSPCSSAFSNPTKVWLRNRRNPPPVRTLIKCGGGGAVREIDESQFSDVVLKSERPVLVEFVATWCGPCRLIAPAVQALAQEAIEAYYFKRVEAYFGRRAAQADRLLHEYEEKLVVVKVDHDSNPRLIEEYKVYGLPTLIFFQNGQEVPESRREGAITKAKLKDYVDKLLETVSIV